MANIIVGLIIVAIIAAAIIYIVREKKKGTKCIGCPYAGEGGCSSSSCGIDN